MDARKRTARSSNGSTVTIDAGFLARVYHGDDPEGFAQFVARASVDPNFLVLALHPDQLAIVELTESTYGLGRVAYGHTLSGDFKFLKLGLAAAARLGCRHFIYPVADDQPNAEQIGRILTGRYEFMPYQRHYLRRL